MKPKQATALLSQDYKRWIGIGGGQINEIHQDIFH